jgi:hypothetical protein
VTKEKRPLFVPCYDLDDNLTASECFDHVYRNSRYVDNPALSGVENFEGVLSQGFYDMFNNRPQELINDFIRDTSDGLLARTIKLSIAKGDKNAIVTFNMSLRYTNFTLALLGLTEEEINKVIVRFREEDERPEDKTEYIEDVLEELDLLDIFNNGNTDHPRYPILTLLDDNKKNCNAADDMGIFALSSVEDETEVYTEKLYTFLDFTKEELISVTLPSPEERFELAFKMMPLKPKAVEVNCLKRSFGQTLVCRVNAGVAPVAVECNDSLEDVMVQVQADSLEQVKKRTRFSSRIAAQRAQKENAIIDV